MGQIASVIGGTGALCLPQRGIFTIKGISIFKDQELTTRIEIDEEGVIRLQEVPGSSTVSFHLNPRPEGAELLLALPEVHFPEEDIEIHFEAVLNPEGSAGTKRPVGALTLINATDQKNLEAVLQDHRLNEFKRQSNATLIEDYKRDVTHEQKLNVSWRWSPPSKFDYASGCTNYLAFVEHTPDLAAPEILASFRFWLPPFHQRLSQFVPKSSAENKIEPIGDYPEAMTSNQGSKSAFPWHSGPPSPSYLEAAEEVSIIGSGGAQTATEKPASGSNVDDSSIVDGPLFRATIGSLEKKTTTFRRDVKNVLKAALAVQVAGIKSIECDEVFQKYLYNMARDRPKSLKPVLDLYINDSLIEAQKVRTNLLKDMDRSLIRPLRRLYEEQLKPFELRKRKFERESQEYYQSTNRYLGKSNDSTKDKQAEKKYRERKMHWDLIRFDYLSFLRDLNGGRREQVLITALSRFAITQYHAYTAALDFLQGAEKNVESLHFALDGAERSAEASRQQQEEKRRLVEISAAKELERLGYNGVNSQSSQVAAKVVLPNSAEKKWSQSSTLRGDSEDSNLIIDQDITALAEASKGHKVASAAPITADILSEGDDELRKEGFLWATSRTVHESSIKLDQHPASRLKWHKVWTVCAGGKLTEYTNWKTAVEVKGPPTDLKLAKARVATGIDRRFCFEVVTPNFRRVYQATSAKDMESWLHCLAVASEYYLCQPRKSRGLSVSSSVDSTSKEKIDRSKSTGLGQFLSTWNLRLLHRSSHHRQSPFVKPQSSGNGSSARRRDAVQDGTEPQITSTNAASKANQFMPPQIIALKDCPINNVCANCQIENPRWVVWNKGLFVCINCAGRHRSLGTHISKVKSLDLDTFRPEEVDQMVAANNAWHNKEQI